MDRGPILVVAGIMLQQDRVLICQRKADAAFPLKWEFPGGKVEPNEGLEDALERELDEELGIRIECPEEFRRYRHTYESGFEVELCFFLVSQYSGAIENKLFQEITWAKLTELSSFDFLAGDRGVIEALQEVENLKKETHRTRV
jgi:8-oxo-dGTP diphosphatase